MSIPGKQNINVGLPNEPTGSDSLRAAFIKVENNFSNLFACASPYNTFTAGSGVGVVSNAITGTVTVTNTGVRNIIAGTNITVDQSNGNVTISSTGGGNGNGGGTVTSVGLEPVSNTRLTVTGGPNIVSSGTFFVDLATSGVTSGTYTNPNISVDSFGRVTTISNGSIAGTVTSVGLNPGTGIQINGGPITTSGDITVTNTGVVRINPGQGISVSSGNGNVTISTTTTGGTVTSVGITSNQLVVAGSPIVQSGIITVDLPDNATFAGNINANRINANGGTINGNLNITGNISPAAANKVGGIKPGPGVDISLDGELTIDTANLPLSFGDFTASNNVLSIVNIDEDMILRTEGNAEIQLIGNIGFYKPDGLPPNVANRFFSTTSDGQIQILVSNIDPLSAAVNIIGTTAGNFSPPVNTGVMLQLTGQANIPSRFYNDGVGAFAAFVGRRVNGTPSSPTPIVAGDEIIRISATGYNGTEIAPAGSARIVFQAMENYTPANSGSNLSFWTAAIGSNTLTKIVTIDNANGLVATKLASTGNANVGNLGAAAGVFTANVTAGNVYANLGTIGTSTATISGNATAGNLLSSGAITSNSATAGVGYTTGAGGTVTQLTDKTTAVTLNKVSGEITMSNAQLNGDATVSFTLNNSTITNTDVIILNQVSDANIGFYSFNGKCNTGNAVISVHNMTNNNRSDAIVIRYAIIKAAIN